jgi:hypothetical protein
MNGLRLNLSTAIGFVVACLLAAPTANAQLVEMGFRLAAGSGSTLELVAGRTHEIRAHTTFEAFESQTQGWTQVVEIFSDDLGGNVCLGVESSETCTTPCKEILIGQPLLALGIGGLTFVSQPPSDLCAEGSALDPDPNRVGFTDTTFMKIGQRLPAGFYRTLPFTIVVNLPVDQKDDIDVRIEYSGNLRGGGNELDTHVSYNGRTLKVPHEDINLLAYEFTIRPVDGGARAGDDNSDGNVDVFDAIALLRQLFLGDAPPCAGPFGNKDNRTILDHDGSGIADLTDAIYLLTYVIIGGPEPVGGSECRDDLPNCLKSCRL